MGFQEITEQLESQNSAAVLVNNGITNTCPGQGTRLGGGSPVWFALVIKLLTNVIR